MKASEKLTEFGRPSFMEILNSSMGVHSSMIKPAPTDDLAMCPLMHQQLSERTLLFFMWAGVFHQVHDSKQGFSKFFRVWYFVLRIFLCLAVVFSVVRINFYHKYALADTVLGCQILAIVPYIHRIQVRLSSPCKPSDIVHFEKHTTYCQIFLALSLMVSLPYPIFRLLANDSDKFPARGIYCFLLVAQVALCLILSASLLVTKADLSICLHAVSSLRLDQACRQLTVARFSEVREAIEERVRENLWPNNLLVVTNVLNVVAAMSIIYGVLGYFGQTQNVLFSLDFSKEILYLGIVAYDALLINHSADKLTFDLAEMLVCYPQSSSPTTATLTTTLTHPHIAAIVSAVGTGKSNTYAHGVIAPESETKHNTEDDEHPEADGEKYSVYAQALRICVAAEIKPIGYPILFYRVRPIDMLVYLVSVVGSAVVGLVQALLHIP